MAKRPKDLSSLISSGRADKGVPKSRGQVLEALLRKRAAAWRSGMDDLESKLRVAEGRASKLVEAVVSELVA